MRVSRRTRQRRTALAVLLMVIVALAVWVSVPSHTARNHGASSGSSKSNGSAENGQRRGNRVRGESGTGSNVTTTPITRVTSPFGTGLTTYLNGRTGSFTAALYDLRTGQTFELHPGVTQDEASIVKVDILATLLSQQFAPPTSESATEQQLAASMIEDSDNDSATTLWNQSGGPTAIADFNARIHLTDTTPSPCVNCAGFPWPGWGLTTTTALDQVHLLTQFVSPSAVLSDAQRFYGLDLLENITPSEAWGVSEGPPAGVIIALKNGWLPLSGESDWQVNSVGWIDGDGRDYILAVLTTGSPTEQYGIDTIGELSSLVWGALGETP